MASNRFEGLCAGGPHDGKMLAGDRPTIMVPIMPPMRFRKPDEPPEAPVKFSSGEYNFKPSIGMWIWRGKWPLKT